MRQNFTKQPSAIEQIKGLSNWKQEKVRWRRVLSHKAWQAWEELFPLVERKILADVKDIIGSASYGYWQKNQTRMATVYFSIFTDPSNPDACDQIACEIVTRELKQELKDFECPRELLQACKNFDPSHQAIVVFVHLPLGILNWQVLEFDEGYLAKAWRSMQFRESEFFDSKSKLVPVMGHVRQNQVDAYNPPERTSKMKKFMIEEGPRLIPIGLAGWWMLKKKGVVLVLKEDDQWTARYVTQGQVPFLLIDYQDPETKVAHFLKIYDPEKFVVIVLMYAKNVTYQAFMSEIVSFPHPDLLVKFMENTDQFLPTVTSPSLQKMRDVVVRTLEASNVRLPYPGLTF